MRRRLPSRGPRRGPVLALSSALLWACALGGAAGPVPSAGEGSPSGAPGAGGPQEAPRLVVLVVVDQLRADLLDRYHDLFQHGFRRLREEGHVFGQATHRHAGTFTAPGHATLATGVFPSRHGIVANEWAEQTPAGLRRFYNTFDSTAPVVGAEGLEGRSPAKLVRQGLGDWIRAAAPGARVASVSTKDRSAILMGGKGPGHVYWIESAAGGFVTSTFYRDGLPGWVRDFNAGEVAALHADSVWESTVPAAAEALSRPDSFPWEFDGVHTTFPHDVRLEVPELEWWGFREWVRHTPRLDEATLGLALEAVDELELGRRGVTDYLAVGFSQVDYVGHRYGPLSREQLDNLLRLDSLVGRLLEGLDERVGQGAWVLAFTGDHGVVDIPEWRAEQGESGLRVGRTELRAFIGEVNAILSEGGEATALQARVREHALASPFVEAVYTHTELVAGEVADSFAPLFRNSYFPGRYAGLLGRLALDVRMVEGTVADGTVRGTTHGSPYWYDRHVPLVFLGAGVEPGRSEEPAYTVDVAPTLAALAGIGAPDDLDGRVLLR